MEANASLTRRLWRDDTIPGPLAILSAWNGGFRGVRHLENVVELDTEGLAFSVMFTPLQGHGGNS
jgi:hypothetical protein